MRTRCALMSMVAVVWLVGECAPGAEGESPALRQEAVRRLAEFRQLTASAAERGIDVSRERVTIVTAERFLTYADWDARNPDKLEAAIAAWWRVRKQAKAISRAMPARELREVLEILAEARRELERVRKRPESRRAAPRADVSALELADGYFRYKGRPVLLSSFVWMPSDAELHEAYGEIGGTFVHPPHLRESGGKVNLRYKPKAAGEAAGYVFLGHSSMPSWARRKHPKIGVGRRHFTGYDIDHPAVREVWRDLLAGVVPKVAGHTVTRAGYLLANEPHWFSARGEWDTGPVSEHTHAKLRQWLRARYGTIGKLNGLWGSRFASFAEVSVEVPIDPKLRGTAAWYDWCRFNMHRVTEWFAFLKSEIRRNDADAKVHIKLIPGHFAQGSRSHGLDFEALVRLQDIIGCDAKVVNAPRGPGKDDWTHRYALDWRNLAMPYDFFTSVGPGKLLFDSEFHGLSTVHWRDPDMRADYVRCVYWLAHLHGMAMNQTWYWGRTAEGAPKPQSQSGFHGSNLTSPRVMNAFGRTMKELNAFAPEVVALAGQPKRVRLFYCETSAIQDAAYMDHVHGTYRALYHSGAPLGFVTGRMLTDATPRTLASWPVVVVAHATHATAAERTALQRYLDQGGTAILAGDENLMRDEYGRPCKAPLTTRRGKGTLRRATDKDGQTVGELVSATLVREGLLPAVALRETHATARPGCVWRTAPWKGGHLLLILNLGKGPARIRVDADRPCHNLITNAPHASGFMMEPLAVRLLFVSPTARR